MGGCQSLHTNGRDEALALPTEASARIALRTQQIVANESGAADIADPLGGSYALEALTDELEERAIAYLTRIDEMGGMVEAIARGYPQRVKSKATLGEIANSLREVFGEHGREKTQQAASRT
jgi:methylmalonyl-CoA mutase, N-terminal domain